MQKVNHPQGRWRNVVFGCIGLFVILADQLSKAWIRSNLDVGQSIFDVGFFQLVRVQNTGAAFGIFRGHSTTLVVVAFVGIAIILFLVFFLRRRWNILDNMPVMLGIGLVLGGTIGNLIDRLRLGNVTDFLDFKVWPAFNVADSAVTIGVIIIAYSVIFLAKPAKYEK